MDFIFSFEMDQLLREAVNRLQIDSSNGADVKKNKQKWEEISKMLPGPTPKQVQQRWNAIKNRPGLEYSSLPGYKTNRILENQMSSTPNKSSIAASIAGQIPRSASVNQRPESRDGKTLLTPTQLQQMAAKRPLSASAVRISATRPSSVGQLRGATLASTVTPVLAFSKTSAARSSLNANSVLSPKPQDAEDKNSGDTDGSDDSDKEMLCDSSTMVIHVCDENRGIDKDFTCRKDVLLSEMAYFRSYIKKNESCDDIDISVHCDIQIFEWLIKYLNDPRNPPSLDAGNVISILISSQFLKMEKLVNLCLGFVRDNVNDILKLPIDLNCLNNQLLKKLSELFNVDDLDSFIDRKDKLLSKMYMKKLESLLQDPECALYRCGACNELFTSSQRMWMVCPKAQIFIDFHGTVVAEHVASASWDVNNYLLSLRSRKISWRDIYWRVWGLVNTLHCIVCKVPFPVAKLGFCSYHPQQPAYQQGCNIGLYPCCNASVKRFDTSASTRPMGCATRNHVVEKTGPDAEILGFALKRLEAATMKFNANDTEDDFALDDADNNDEDDESTPQQPPSQQQQQQQQRGDSEADSEATSQDSPSTSDSESDESSDDRLRNGTNGKKKVNGVGSANRPVKSDRAKLQIKTAPRVFASDKERRQWRQDSLREEECRRLSDLLLQLDTMRADSIAKQQMQLQQQQQQQPKKGGSTGSGTPTSSSGLRSSAGSVNSKLAASSSAKTQSNNLLARAPTQQRAWGAGPARPSTTSSAQRPPRT